MKRKKKTTLPRVTLMAFDRKAPLAFCESVEALRHIAADLRAVADELKTAATATVKKKRAPKPQPENQQWVTPPLPFNEPQQ